MNKQILLVVLLFVVTSLNAQNFKFGKVSKEELLEKYNKLDSVADATVLYSNEKVSYKYSADKGFTVSREIHKRIKIYSAAGVEWANHSVKLYDKSRTLEEEISGLKAFTFNIENGKIVKSKLTKSGVFEEKKNEYWKFIKYTMPNIKAGCVVEYKYIVDSPFASNLNDVYLQEGIPIKKLDFKIEIPEFYKFKLHHNIKSALNPKFETVVKNRKLVFSYRGKPGQSSLMDKQEETIEYQANLITYYGNNIPAIYEESFVSNINDYKSKLSFELLSTESFKGEINNYATNWNSVTDNIYKSENFGNQLTKSNYYKKDIDALTQSLTTKPDKIYAIHNFVKAKVKWNDFIGVYTLKGVKKAYNEGVGNVADINLMLTSMLRYAGVNANPVLVSTKDNGVPLYPTRQGFNYVICGVEVNDKIVLLDATSRNSTINIVPKKVLNWQGRIVREHGSSAWVNLFPKKNSTRTTMVSATLNKDLVFAGKVRNQQTDYYAYDYRNKYAGVVNDDLVKGLSKDKGEIDITNLNVKNDRILGKPIQQTYDFTYEDGLEEIGTDIYVSPMLFLAEEDNVFNSETRQYPIDFKFPRANKNIINISIPDGYRIKSIPESVKLVMSDNLGEYSFLVKQSGNKIQVSEMFSVNFPIVPVSYYPELNEIYKKLVEKNSEKIVLEKI